MGGVFVRSCLLRSVSFPFDECNVVERYIVDKRDLLVTFLPVASICYTYSKILK